MECTQLLPQEFPIIFRDCRLRQQPPRSSSAAEFSRRKKIRQDLLFALLKLKYYPMIYEKGYDDEVGGILRHFGFSLLSFQFTHTCFAKMTPTNGFSKKGVSLTDISYPLRTPKYQYVPKCTCCISKRTIIRSDVLCKKRCYVNTFQN